MKTQQTMNHKTVTYKRLKKSLADALTDLEILSGNNIGPSGVTWKDVAGTAAVNLHSLANKLEEARKGNHESFLVFPAPSEFNYDTESFED